MKKVLFIVVFALVSAGVFAEYRKGELNTPEGLYDIQFGYVGKNCGQQTANDRIKGDRDSYFPFTIETDIQLSKVQWDIVKSGLDTFEHSRGDTYLFLLIHKKSMFSYQVIVEYTSATQYNYWTWLTYMSDR